MSNFDPLGEASANGLLQTLSDGQVLALTHLNALDPGEQLDVLILFFGMFDALCQDAINVLSSRRSEDVLALASIFTRCSSTLESFAIQLQQNGQEVMASPQ